MFLTPGRKYQPAKERKPLVDILDLCVGANNSVYTARYDQYMQYVAVLSRSIVDLI